MATIRNRFSIVYSTNVSKNKTFILRDKNILNKIHKEEKDKKLLNRGDNVIYLDPKDSTRNGYAAQITRLNFKQVSGKTRVIRRTQTPRATPAMGTQIHISAEPADSYDIKIYKSPAHKLKRKAVRIVKGVKRKDLLYKNAAFTVFHFGTLTPAAAPFTPGSLATKKIDNDINKTVKVLLGKGTTFQPDLVYNAKTNSFHPPTPKEQFKIKNYIIEVQPDKTLFKYKMKAAGGGLPARREITVHIKLFLAQTKGPEGTAAPTFSMKTAGNAINRSCNYHWDALKNVGKRLRGGGRNLKGGGFTAAWVVKLNRSSILKFIREHLSDELILNTEMGDALLDDLRHDMRRSNLPNGYIVIERHEPMVLFGRRDPGYIFSWAYTEDKEDAAMMCDDLEANNAHPYPTDCKWIEITDNETKIGGRRKTRRRRKKKKSRKKTRRRR